MTSLTKKTSMGLLWSAAERFGCQAVSFGIQILLARLIAPTEFGLLALLTIFIVFSQMIIDGGFGQAIIQKKEVSQTDISTVFFFNFFLSLVMYAAIFFAAPWIADFYHEPRLVLLVRVLGINLLINAFGKIQNCLLVRNLRFKHLFRITLPSMIISGGVGVTMAFWGFEVWAIVAFQISNALIANVCYWVLADRCHWPQMKFSFDSLWTMGRFGLGILGSSFLYQGARNIYGLLIGKVFSFDQLAFYNRAQSFHQLPASTLTQVLNRVLFPVFSTIQDDNQRILRAVRKGIPIVAFVMFPLMAFLMCAADEIVVILLTEKWLPAATYMRWFPIIGVLYPIAAIQLSVVNAKGRSGLFFWMDVVKNAVSLTVLFFTIQQGVLTVVIGQVCSAMFSVLFVNTPVFWHVYQYKPSDQFKDVVPYFAAAGISACVAVIVTNSLSVNSIWLAFGFKLIIFFAIYLLFCHLAKLSGLQQVINRVSCARAKQASLISGGSNSNGG